MKTESVLRKVQSSNAVALPLQALSLLLLGLLTPQSSPAVGNVVISQVFGGGGGSGYYRYDYIELYNRTDTAVVMTEWSLQYASASGAFTGGSQLYAIPSGTTIPAGGYLLVRCGSAGTGGITNFPVTPDLTTGNLNLSQNSGKVALANVNTALGTVSSLPDPRIEDFVGFGAANLGEGGTTVNGGVALNNMQGCVRKMAGFKDTDNNNLDFDVVTPPAPRNSKVGKLHFFAGNLLPPTNGMYVSPAMWHQAYANGIIISNLAHRIFLGSTPPPPPGGPVSHTFGSTVEFEISTDSGATFAPVTMPGVAVTVAVSSNSTVGGYAVYTNGMTSLAIAGGGLPSGVQIRQSPGTNSPGQTRVQTIAGGYMVSSFFDIFTEISTDGGSTWKSATNGPIHMELKPDPALVAATTAPRTVLPMPNGQYVSPALWHQLYQSGIVIKDLKHKLFTAWMEPPVFGYTNTHNFNSQLDFQLSLDGGTTFTAARVTNASMTVKISNVRGFQGQSTYETEVTQLDLSGGDLPANVKIRVSTNNPTTGGTSMVAGGGGGGAGGGAAISSFFDIFTEVSTDSGYSYYPATNGPAHMELQRIAPANLFTDNLLPPLAGEYISPQQWHAYYANGYIITNVFHRYFDAAITPPSPGGTLSHTFGSRVEFDLSQDGGLSYTHANAPATVGVRITARTGDDGTTVYYDTEMTQLDISGGDLPPEVQIRASQARPSQGRTTSSAVSGGNGGYQIDSFFDVYTEISTDGQGLYWSPATNGPSTVTLKPSGPAASWLNIVCPTNMTVTTTNPAGAIVSFAPQVSGNCPPFTTNCAPPSGSTFPIGTTIVTCTANDACNNATNCTFTITVVPQPLSITCPTNMTVTATNPAGAVVYFAPQVSGGCPPINTNCNPPSGSTFPIGMTVVNCTAMDTCGQQTNCSFTITVVPRPLSITCPSNITVRATSPAGAVVTYTVTTSGGCPPITLTCMPPSGSTFPIGTTTVNCAATDACGQQANCTFTVTVLRLLNKNFFKQNLLPPTNGVFVAPTPVGVVFPGGIIVSNIAHGLFSTGFVPPLTTGGSLVKSFNSQVQVDISLDDGASWQSCIISNVPVTVGITNNGLDSGDTLYGTELTQLDISGGTLPAGVVIRASQRRASLGETRIEATAGGYQIDSFFDIYLEISTDDGGVYVQAPSPCTVQVKPDPALIAAAPAPRTVLPMPNGQYISPTAWHQLYANGIIIKDIRHKLFTGWMEPPLFGASQTHTFDSQLDFQLSTDGGTNFYAARAPATMTVTIGNVRGFEGRSTYETEVTQLDVAGGDLPARVMIRESPTKASKGGTSSLGGGGGAGKDGGAAISSFFDIFTEVSTDGGGSWNPATNGPAHMELQRIAPVHTFTNNLLPVLTGEYISPQQWHAYYGNGIVITNVVHRSFTAAITPPLPGYSTSHTFGSTLDFDVSYDGGLTFSNATAPATVSVQITCRLGDDGVTEYYDTEMTQLSVSGGGLGSAQIRESPTKASLGRTTSSTNAPPSGSYQIDSFFDVYTEISPDSGYSWYPTVAGPATVTLQPRSPQAALSITCPTNMTVTTTNPAGAVVYFSPQVSGGCPPITTNCAPPSGTTFPIGTTTVTCTASDACGQQTNCSFTITVVPQPLSITCPSNITVRATSPAGAVVNYTVTTSGGCPPITVFGNPPSGSTFPIGVTIVNCTATDTCGQQANCTFKVTVLRQLQKRFYAQNLLPPTNGLFVAPTPVPVPFPGGILVSNIAHGVFSTNVVPPLTPGGSLVKSFKSQVQVDISLDYGTTWHSCVVSNVPVTVGITNQGPDGDDILYTTELTQLDISGGTLPSGVYLRESQTKASLGETRIEETLGGYQIDSFFDIYLEVSTDFGVTYQQALSACTVEVKPDPALVAVAPAPRPLLPMPNGQYVGPRQAYGNGVIVKEIRHKLFTAWDDPPGFGVTHSHTFNSQLDFQLSMDSGATFTATRAPATITVTIKNVRGFQGRTTYDTEITQLDVAGGELPPLVRIRESPTKASKGGTSALAGGGGGGGGGGVALNSFFDVYTEVSTDGGLVYWPTTNGPCHMELHRIAPVHTYTNNLLPPFLSDYASQQHAKYGTDFVLTNVFHRNFLDHFTPPPLGGSDTHTFGSTVEFDLSQDGGHTFTHASAPATVTVTITGRTNYDGYTVYYDTEMTQLHASGGGLPPGIEIRESPTKASLGRTTTTGGGGGGGGGGYQIDSFFDVYTEITTGGSSWQPTTSGPAEVILEPETIVVGPVTITSIQLVGSGAQVRIDYTGGSGSQFVLLKSTDISTSRSTWARVATNPTTPGTFIIPVLPGEDTAFYSIKSE